VEGSGNQQRRRSAHRDGQAPQGQSAGAEDAGAVAAGAAVRESDTQLDADCDRPRKRQRNEDERVPAAIHTDASVALGNAASVGAVTGDAGAEAENGPDAQPSTRPVFADVPAVACAPAHLACRVVSVLLQPAGLTPAPSLAGGAGGAGPVAGGSSAAAAGGPASEPDIGHCLLLCKVVHAYVRRAYWTTGKTFGPPAAVTPPAAAPAVGAVGTVGGVAGSGGAASDVRVPPLLCFMGSKQFAAMLPLPPAGME
jgi:hypothetical protein